MKQFSKRMNSYNFYQRKLCFLFNLLPALSYLQISRISFLTTLCIIEVCIVRSNIILVKKYIQYKIYYVHIYYNVQNVTKYVENTHRIDSAKRSKRWKIFMCKNKKKTLSYVILKKTIQEYEDFLATKDLLILQRTKFIMSRSSIAFKHSQPSVMIFHW